MMTKEIYYLDNALQGIDFDIKSLDFRYWFTGDEGYETYSKIEYEKIKSYANAVRLSQQNGVNYFEFDFENK